MKEKGSVFMCARSSAGSSFCPFVSHCSIPVDCAQVDVEGWEWSVMEGAQGLQRNYNVENIVMEYSPGGKGERGGKEAG